MGTRIITSTSPAAIVICLVLASLWSSGPLSAAVYEFTVTGQVDFSLFGSDPSVGDPFTIRYAVDSEDLHPTPTYGVYAATSATVEFPSVTYTPVARDSFVTVTIFGDGSGMSFIKYQTHVFEDGALYPYLLDVSIGFPSGVITSDELRPTLPLAEAQHAHVRVIPIVSDMVRGDITFYAGVEVPEPVHAGLYAAGVILLHRHPRTGKRGISIFRQEYACPR